MSKIVTCRKCHQPITIVEEERGVTWHQRSHGWYYHLSCWNDFIDMTQNKNSAEWNDLIFDLIARELKSEYNYFQVNTQLNKFMESGLTAKGIYYTAYWYFIVKKKPYKPEYGLGIIPHVYNESTEYWVEQENKREGIMDEIARLQRIEAEAGRKVAAKTSQKKKPTKPQFLDDLFDE